MTIDYLTGDALETVRGMPDGSVDISTCSPPFLALRDYNGVEGQWGSEANPAAFLDSLLELATETRRVLTPFGSLAWELGDTYSGAMPMYDGRPGAVGTAYANRLSTSTRKGDGWPLAKSLTGVPTLFAWSLAYGRNLLNPTHEFEPWRVRNVIVWARSNPPVGALGDKYRPATSYITVATPSRKRWFDLDAVRSQPRPENQRGTLACEGKIERATLREATGAPPLDHWHDEYDGDLTWLVNSRGSKLAHYAMWPAKLAERLILSMCPAHVCTTCREPRRRIVNGSVYYDSKGREHTPQTWVSGISSAKGAPSLKPDGGITSVRLQGGWSDCGHGTWRNGHVLDPFAGTGTTLAVADIHGRDATGIDLDPANPGLYPRRREEVRKALLQEQPQVAGQLGLFGA